MEAENTERAIQTARPAIHLTVSIGRNSIEMMLSLRIARGSFTVKKSQPAAPTVLLPYSIAAIFAAIRSKRHGALTAVRADSSCLRGVLRPLRGYLCPSGESQADSGAAAERTLPPRSGISHFHVFTMEACVAR